MTYTVGQIVYLLSNENGTGNGVESGSVAVVDLGNGQTGKINLKELQA